MPDNTPVSRQELLSGLGAQLLFSPAREGSAGARALAETWAARRGWYYTDWLACDDNPEYHRRVTGPAVAEAIAREGKSLVDAVFIGVGSGRAPSPGWANASRPGPTMYGSSRWSPYECQALAGGPAGAPRHPRPSASA